MARNLWKLGAGPNTRLGGRGAEQPALPRRPRPFSPSTPCSRADEQCAWRADEPVNCDRPEVMKREVTWR